jgi:catechol 2,3-dioxygenase-like lactoylglutathione lyase family enzyme
MLRSADITAFLATANPARAKAFYQDILGLSLLTDDQFALAFDANGTELRIQKVEKLKPHPFTALGWRVPDIAKAVAGLVKQGVTFERYEFMKQDKLGVWKAPSGAKVAWFKDPDGNLLSLTEVRAP